MREPGMQEILEELAKLNEPKMTDPSEMNVSRRNNDDNVNNEPVDNQDNMTMGIVET